MNFYSCLAAVLVLMQGYSLAHSPKKRLKILVSVFNFPKLSEPFVLNQIIGMLNHGHEVAIYAKHKEEIDKIHEDILSYNLLDKVYYNTLPEDIETYDILLGQFGTGGSRMINCKKQHNLSAKVVSFFRGFDITKHLAHHPHCYDDLLAQGDFFLTNCEFFRKKIIALGIPPEKVMVNFSSLNLKRFSFKERSPHFEKEIRLITTGRIVEKKGIHVALKALALLVEQYPQIRYTIAGDGSYKEIITQQVQDLKLEEYVTFTGPYTADELPGLLDQADIFVGPSVTASSKDQDAIPNTLKEAMAVGIPVVTTYHGGIPEMITNGVNGLLAEEYDAQGLAKNITYLINHPEALPRLTKAARKTVEDTFELCVNNNLLVDILERVAANEL